MNARWFAALLLATPVFGMPAYVTDYFDTWKPANWQANGAIGVSGDRLTSADAAGGTAMSLPQPSAYFYEIFAQVRLLQSGGRYTILARASADARYGTVTAGSFYAVDFSNVVMSGTSGTATMKIVKRVGGVLTQVAQFSVGVKDWMNVRVLVRPGGSQGFLFSVSIDERHTYYGEGDAALTSGKPGLGVASAPAVNGFENVWLYNYESAAPTPVLAADIASSVSSTAIDLQWKGSFDNGGSGTWQYDVYRNGQYVRSTRYATFTDNTLSASTPYQYFIVAMDYHLNQVVGSTITITTPGAGSFDAHRNGVEPNGTYWGGGSENIDVQSGNLNYTLPLLKAVGRGQTSVQLALSYNSQNWRKDANGTPSYWKLGRDIGYGFGWRLQAGSMTAYFSDWWTVHHWVYTDATGAEYRLDQQSGGVFTSKEGIYVTFDANVGKLRFNDGSWWSFGALSTGGEEDAGTFYPTLMQDSNGNQVVLSYRTGIGAGWPNSSGRLAQINDAVSGMAAPAFSFTYVDQGDGTVPHLQSITSTTGRESYTFSSSSQSMYEPFGGGDFGSAWMLTGITNTSSSITTTLGYNSSGELTSATLPSGGSMQWEYVGFAYSNLKTYREVSNRYLKSKTGGDQWRYEFKNPDSDSTRQIHEYRAVIDWGADSVKQYWLNTGATLPYAGVVYVYQVRRNNGGGNVTNGTLLSHTEYTWALNGTNPYVSAVKTARDGVWTKQQQWLDGFGNITQRRVYDTDLLLANARTYNYTYLSDPGYTSITGLHIRNRLTSATMTAGGQTYTLATNTYDGVPTQDNWAADPENKRLHDTAYGTSYLYRGNLRTSWTMSSQTTKTMTYDIGGNVIQTTGGGGPQVDATFANGSNYLVPSTVTPNSEANLASSAQWDSLLRLTSATGPNGATMTVSGYDAASRPGTTTSATGVVTSFTYSNSAPQVRATVNGRWTETYYDGLGRTVEVRSGVGATIKSIVVTEYAACGCSPLGKVWRVTRPFTPNDTVVYWTTYEYDALGRTTRVALPNNSGATTYTYTGNTVTVTDPGGKWKTMTVDGFGNLVTVVEPNPAGGTNFTTSYVYNSFNQLTTVTMPRPTGTQTRSFVFNAAGQMTSVTQPETGTTTFGYDASGRPLWKRDAKQQKTEYFYDAYNRTTQILRYKRVAGADVLDPAQKTVYSYDSAVNGWGRLGSISTYQHFGDLTGATPIVESFEYTVAGLVSKKTLNVTGTSAVSVSYEWDNEGRPVAQKFPDFPIVGTPDWQGPRFTWGYDSMGRLSTMGQTETAASGWSTELVTSTQYNAAGQMTQLVRPGGTENREYNVLGQLTKQAGLGRTVEYSYNATANDGRITKRKELSGEEVDYLYDSLGRLISAATTATTGWGLNFTYDGFGNKTGQTAKPGWTGSGTVPQPSFTVDAATNRLGGFGYDANGNVISGLAGLTGTYTYDVENRMVDNGVETYGYGAGNRRLWKKSTVSGSWAEVYLYGLGGEVLEVFRGMMGSPLERQSYAPTQRAWFGGRLIEKKGTAMNADRLGTYEKSFPYGELATAPTTSGEKFATYWRDAGSGLDYAVNRYYSPQMGRFLSADPYQASGGPAEPGSWNRYAYVEGDPVNFTDQGGLQRQWICYYSSVGDFGDGFGWLRGYQKASCSASQTGKSSVGTDDGGGTSAVSNADLVNATNKLIIARDKAMEALNNPECEKLFLGADGKPLKDPVNGGTLDPRTILRALTNSRLDGTDRGWGSLGFDNFGMGDSAATTQGFDLRVNSNGPYYLQVKVVIQLKTWNEGLYYDATVTLLHELGHVLSKLAAGFSPNGFESDAIINASSERNTRRVQLNCMSSITW